MTEHNADIARVAHAKDIPDGVFLAAVAYCMVETAKAWDQPTAWCDRWAVTERLSQVMGTEVHEKVVMAKAAKIIKRKLMDGCPCGCRGDYDLRGFPGDPFAQVEHFDGRVPAGWLECVRCGAIGADRLPCEHFDGTDYGPGPGDVDDSPEYHAARNDGDRLEP